MDPSPSIYRCRNEMGRGLTQRPVIVEVSHDLRGDSWGCVPRSLFWQDDLDRDGECEFDCLTFSLVSLKAHREGEKILFRLRMRGLRTGEEGTSSGLITYLTPVCGKTGGLDQISNKDVAILYCLANEVKVDYTKLIWEDIIHKLNKETREKVVIILGKKPGATTGLRRNQFLKHTSESKTEASKSKTSKSKKETQSSSAKNKSPSHPSPPTLVVGEMHKAAHQAAGGPTSLGTTSEEGAHPQLRHDASANFIAEADPGNSALNDSIPSQQGMDKGTKNYLIDHIFVGTNQSVLVDQTKSAGDGLKTAHTDSDTRSAFFTPDSPQDEPIIVSYESEEEETKKDDTHATSHDVLEDPLFPHPPSPKSAHIQELMA
nr:hypothetical protein [Tanacetum cinerariifolium]